MTRGCPHCGLVPPSVSALGITARQRDLLEYLESQAHHVVQPSIDEIKAALGLRSKSGVHRLLEALVERGYVRRIRNRARALQVIGQRTEVRP